MYIKNKKISLFFNKYNNIIVTIYLLCQGSQINVKKLENQNKT